MATAIDRGKQSRVFYYRQPLSSLEFNRVFSKTFPPGIYEGGGLSRLSENRLSVSPLSVIIEDANVDSDIAVRIRTTESIELDILLDHERPLLAVRYEWDNTTENYLDFVQVTETKGGDATNLHDKDLVIGKIVFELHSGSLRIASENSFDYTRTTRSFANPLEDYIKPFFTVRTPEGEGNKNKVYVEGGKILTTQGLIELAGGYSPSISDTTQQGRHDYVYLDEAGQVKIQEGSPSASPTTKPFYGRKVIAVIRRGGNRNDIKGSDIYGVTSAERGEIQSTTILVKDIGTGEVFAKNNDGLITVDMALRELWAKIVAVEVRATNLEGGAVYKAGSQTVTGEKTFNILPKMLDSNSNPLEASDNSHPITKKYYENTTSGTGAVQVGVLAEDQSNFNQDIYGTKTFKKSPKVPDSPEDNNSAINLSFLKSSNSNVVHRTGNEEINGTKTFKSYPRIPSNEGEYVAPSFDSELIPKKFYDDTGVKLTGNQAISGTKTFNASPKIPDTPADGNSSINKNYLDNAGNSVVHKAGAETISGEKTHTILPKYVSGSQPLTPTSESHAVTKKYVDDNFVGTTGNKNQTVTGTKTFESSPKVPTTPADNNSAINKNYLDNTGNSVVHKSGNETIGGNKTFTSEIKATSFYATSSRKVKENIEDADVSALEILENTKIVRYSYIDDPDSYLHIGFIAEDTPEILTGKDHNVMALSDVCGVLIKAVQELNQKIEYLERGDLNE